MGGRIRSLALRAGQSTAALVAVFLAVHVVLSVLDLFVTPDGMTDVQGIYRHWMRAASAGEIVGIDVPWVYPVGALLPLAIAWLPGDAAFGISWLVLVALLDVIALLVLVLRGGARGRAAAWWWTGLLAALGPVAIGRLDSIAVPVAIVGIVLLARRPAVAGAVLALATWIKVWPAAIVIAVVVTLRARWRIALGAVAASILIAGAALVAGAGGAVLSFLTAQTGRGLQVESVAALPWLWGGSLGIGDGAVYFDSGILTYQVSGSGAAETASRLDLLLALVVVAILVLAAIAVRRAGSEAAARLLPLVLLALTTALVVCDKVLSPQYLTWFTPALVLVALADERVRARSRWAVVSVIAACALTQVLYPYLYFAFLVLHPGMLLLVTVRDALLVAVLAWAVVQLATSTRREFAQVGAP